MAAAETSISRMPSRNTILSRLSCIGSGSNKGNGAGEAAICSMSLERFLQDMFYRPGLSTKSAEDPGQKRPTKRDSDPYSISTLPISPGATFCRVARRLLSLASVRICLPRDQFESVDGRMVVSGGERRGHFGGVTRGHSTIGAC